MSDDWKKSKGEQEMREGTNKIMKDAQEKARLEKEAKKLPTCTISIKVDSDDADFVDLINRRVKDFFDCANLRGMSFDEAAGTKDVELIITSGE